MSDEQHVGEEGRVATSGVAKALLGKVLSHKVFSDRALLWIMLATTFLLPIFFIPGQSVAPEFSKMVLLEVLALAGIFVWAAGRLRDGHIEVPKSALLLISTLLVVQFVASAIASPTPVLSFIGNGYDIGTVNSFVVLYLLLFIGAIVFVTRDRILSLYVAFLLSGMLVMVYHIFRHIFGSSFLDFGVFTSDVSTPVGKWNDLASVVGAIEILILSGLYFFPHNKSLRIPSYLLLTIGLIFLLAIDFTILWLVLFVIVGLLAILSVYDGESAHKVARSEAESRGESHPHKPRARRVIGHLPGFVIVLLVVSFIYGSGLSARTFGANNMSIASTVAKVLHSSPYSEVVLTPSFTFNIVSGTLKQSPLFGTSPNRFATGYLAYKSSDMNRTPFWDSTFDYGLGRIPTYFGTTGVIGTILWLLFIVFILLKARRMYAFLAHDRIVAFLAFSLFSLVIYFWSIAFFYLPNIAIFSMAFIFTGALIAFLASEGAIERYRISFGGGSRLSFIMTPIIIIVIVGVVSGGALLYRQVASLVAFRDAQLAIAVGNIDQAESGLHRANGFAERDIYQRAISNLALIRLQKLSSEKLSQDETARRASDYVIAARTSAERAILLDPTNFENYLQLGGVFDTLGSLGVQNTAEPARQNYTQALRLNPKSPRVLFVLARLEYVSGQKAAAKDYLYQALNERPNFLEAISFLVQIEIGDKNPDAAIAALQKGIAAEPTNFLLRFALGYLSYAKGDFQTAVNQFEAAVYLNPAYADAKYFLGLTYDKLGRRADAITQFTDVQTLNPDNKDVTTILKNLKANRGALDRESVTPTQPVDDALKSLNSGKGTTPKSPVTGVVPAAQTVPTTP